MKIRGGYQPEAGPKPPPPNPPSGGSSVRPAPGPCRLCDVTKAENDRLRIELDTLGMSYRALARQLADHERLLRDLERAVDQAMNPGETARVSHLEKNRQAIREFRAIGCGSCKATGERHVWSNGNLIPTGEVCPACGGTAIAPTSVRPAP